MTCMSTCAQQLVVNPRRKYTSGYECTHKKGALNNWSLLYHNAVTDDPYQKMVSFSTTVKGVLTNHRHPTWLCNLHYIIVCVDIMIASNINIVGVFPFQSALRRPEVRTFALKTRICIACMGDDDMHKSISAIFSQSASLASLWYPNQEVWPKYHQ